MANIKNPDAEQKKSGDRVEEQKTTTNEYPHEKFWISQGGVKFVYGDEPGKEFIRMVHPSGTYSETYPDGKTMNFRVGDSKDYNKGGVTFSVDENNDVHVHGHNNIKIGGGAHIEVMGNAGIAVGGDTALVGMKNFNFNVDNCYMGVRGDFGMRVAGSAKWVVDGTVDFISGKDMLTQAGGTMTDKGSTIQHNP